MRRKITAVILAVALVAGCGTATSGSTSTGTSKETVTSTETKTETSVSVSVSVEPEPEEIPEQKLDTLVFGSYEQDGNPDNGAEPITWIVLKEQDGMKLIVSEKILDCLPYNKGFEATDWEHSSVRKWLNGAFYDTAFTPDEQAKIVESFVPSVEPEAYIEEQKQAQQNTESSESSETTDAAVEIEIPGTNEKVFLLSDFEVKELFPDAEDMKLDEPYAKPTQYALSAGVFSLTDEEYKLFKYEGKYPEDVIGCAWYWLRTQGSVDTKAMDVSCLGEIRTEAHDVGECHDGIRPAMWIQN